MTDRVFMVEPSGWYALTMYPGYWDVPYHSPLRVDGIEWLGEQHITLEFLNLAYAAGVRDFRIECAILKAAPDFLACSPVDQSDRLYVFAKLTRAWMTANFPNVATDSLFDEAGRPDERAFLALV
ncbi:hypothetical protein [Alteraurantiacibacter buctensis]|nr:hypothetical protein [Alteraurantiacibacter buctensis]